MFTRRFVKFLVLGVGLITLTAFTPQIVSGESRDSHLSFPGDVGDGNALFDVQEPVKPFLGEDLDLDGISDDFEYMLIDKYAPILFFEENEDNFPSSVDWYLQKTTLRFHRSGCTDKEMVKPYQIKGGEDIIWWKAYACHHDNDENYAQYSGKGTDVTDFFLQIPNDGNEDTTRHGQPVYKNENKWDSDAKFYSRVVRGPGVGKYWVTYLFFYPYNGWMRWYTGAKATGGGHEGDWENITVEVKHSIDESGKEKFDIVRVNFVAHGIWNWCDRKGCGKGGKDVALRLVGEERPLVFVAYHSHASYPEQLAKWPRGGGLPDDYVCLNTNVCKSLDTRGKIYDLGEFPSNCSQPGIPRDIIELDGGEKIDLQWVRYTGHWGEIGGESGPYGPFFQKMGAWARCWHAPIITAETESDQLLNQADVTGKWTIWDFVPDGQPELWNITVNWGDGSEDRERVTSQDNRDDYNFKVEGNERTWDYEAMHSYVADGSYWVTIMVEDAELGSWDTDGFLVTIDTTPPTITQISAYATATGWNNGDVLLIWACADEFGVVAETIDQTVTGEGADLSATGICEDLAGNTAEATQTGINIDRTPPTDVSGAPNRPPDANGKYTEPVDIVFTGVDALSGIGTCTTVTYDGPDAEEVSVNGSCTDLAGNTSAEVASSTFTYRASGKSGGDGEEEGEEGGEEEKEDEGGPGDAALTINMTVTNPEPLVDEPFSFIIEVSNTGEGPADNVRITDRLPGGLRVDNATSTQGKVKVKNKRKITANIGTLEAGQSVTVTVDVTGILKKEQEQSELCTTAIVTYQDVQSSAESCVLLSQVGPVGAAVTPIPVWLIVAVGLVVLAGAGWLIYRRRTGQAEA
jgi:uncharacterized repeat protein (TIGR01451 family)